MARSLKYLKSKRRNKSKGKKYLIRNKRNKSRLNNKKRKKLSKSFYGGTDGDNTFTCKQISDLLEKKIEEFNPKSKESWEAYMPVFCKRSFSPDFMKSVLGTNNCGNICKIIYPKYVYGKEDKSSDGSSQCYCRTWELSEQEKKDIEQRKKKEAERKKKIEEWEEWRKQQPRKEKKTLNLGELERGLQEGSPPSGRFWYKSL